MAKRLVLVLVALVAGGCDDSISGPSGTDSSTSTTTSTPLTESFEATLSPGGSSFYSFTESTAGSVTVMLASVVQPGKAAALTVPLRIGLGIPAGEGCTVTETAEAMPALTPQLTATADAGIHCVSIADAGHLSGTVIAAVRFTHR